MIYNLGMRLFRNEEDALDFAQDVYLRAYDKLGSFRGDSKPSTWLYSLALNLGLNRLKKERRLKLKDFGSGDEHLASIERLQSQADDPLRVLTDQELEGIVREELTELGDAYRIPLILYYYEKLSYRDIADRLGIKEGTLKSYLHRGKTVLRERLLRRRIDEP